MAFLPIDLNLTTATGRDAALGSAVLTNCYADDLGQYAKVRNPVMACEGFTSHATLSGTGYSAGTNLGAFSNTSGTVLIAAGNNIFGVTSAGAVVSLATSLTWTGTVYFAMNRRTTPQVVMTSSNGVTRMYTSSITTPSFDAAIGASSFTSVCEIDGYFVWTKSNGEFYVSGIDDVTTDPLMFARGATRGLVRGIRRGRDVVLFSINEASFWQNTGQADFPLQRVHLANFGTYAAPAMVSLVGIIDGAATDTVIWPATGPSGEYIGVAMLAGYDARIISNGEVDRAIKGESTVANIRAYTYTSQGHTFYGIRGTNWSFEFNTRTGFWHRRYAAGTTVSPIAFAVATGNVTYIIPSTGSTVSKLSSSLTPASASELQLRTSKNNGSTWTTARTKSIGASGERTTRAVFHRLGQAGEDGMQIELKMTNVVVEGSTAADATIVLPAVHAYPSRLTFNELRVDFVPGVSLTSLPKGFLQFGVDVQKDAA